MDLLAEVEAAEALSSSPPSSKRPCDASEDTPHRTKVRRGYTSADLASSAVVAQGEVSGGGGGRVPEAALSRVWPLSRRSRLLATV